jgi:hypothetical protein
MKIKSIESKEDIKKRQRKNQWIIGGILIFVMLGSTFAVIVDSFGTKTTAGKVDYNGYTFTDTNGFWTTNIGSYKFMFQYNPTQVERIQTKLDYLTNYVGTPLYISSEDYVATAEVYQNLGNIVQRFQGACLNETNCQENWPIKDCSNNFIIIRITNESKIYQDQKCVFIEGKQENITQMTDEFLFWITGIEK